MGLHLEKRDRWMILAFLGVSVLSGFAMEFLQGQALITVHDATFYLPGPALMLGAYFIYRARQRLGGQFERNLEVVGISLAVLGIAWVVFAGYFAAGFPPWGVSSAFWATFLGTLIALMFMTAGYGFYLFWKTMEGDAA